MDSSFTIEDDDGAAIRIEESKAGAVASTDDLPEPHVDRTGSVGGDGVREIIDETDESESESDGEHENGERQSAAAGKWKNGLCGCDRGSFLWSLLCCMYVLGDVQTRAHVTICGNRNSGQPIHGFGVVGVLVSITIFVVIGVVLVAVTNIYETYHSPDWEQIIANCEAHNYSGDECFDTHAYANELKVHAEVMETIMPLAYAVALAIASLATLTIISKTRRTIRSKGNIPGGFCKDLFLSAFCTTCVLAQMDGHVGDQIETTRSDSWKQEELELQNKRKEEDTNVEQEDSGGRERIGLKVCKCMTFLFVVTLISLVIIGLRGEDQLYFTYSIKIFGVLVAIIIALTMVLGSVWGIKRCMKRRSRIQHERQLELGDVEHACENEIV